MRHLVLAIAATLLAPAGGAADAAAARVLDAAAIEFVPLPPGSAHIEVDALGGRIRLRHAGDPARVRRSLARATLCRLAGEVEGAHELRCATRRVAARLIEGALEVRELRGLPHADAADGPPPPPRAVEGDPCAAAGPLARGECRWAAGDPDGARRAWEAALETIERSAALVRLGDLAAARGAHVEALTRYRAAAGPGTWGRIAAARACELNGACLGGRAEAVVFDAVGLPPPLRDDLDLRAARARAFQGDLAGAMARLADAAPSACDRAPLLCRRLILEALRADEASVRLEALLLWERSPARFEGPLVAELARAAAEVAASIGAPGHAARILAAAAEAVPAAELDAHLRRAAQLFLDAGDRARADLLLAFARSRLPRAALATPAWRGIAQAIEAPAGEGAGAPAESAGAAPDPAGDLAAARAAAARAREAARDSQRDPAQVRRDARGEAR